MADSDEADTTPPDRPGPPRPVTVTPRADGPLVVDGPLELVAPDGSIQRIEKLFLCRCGRSADKPRCDGTHKRVGFTAPGVPVARKPGRP